MRHLALTAAVLALVAGTAAGGGLDLSGFVAGETRWFPDEPAYPGQFDGLQSSLVLQPEFRYRTSNRRHTFRLTPFLRLDDRDDERTHFDLREAYWLAVAGDVEVLVGVNTVFWGVTESRHLIDVVNQVDYVEDVDGEGKLGQPMVRLSWQRDWGRLEAFALVGFREMTLPGPHGRLRLPLPITDDADFPDGRSDLDAALRWSHYLGDFDLGLHFFHGMGREPGFRPVTGADGLPALQPFYNRINQLGMDGQWTRDAWLWKLEWLVREGDGDTFAAAVMGFEYTLYQLGGGNADLGLLGEFLYDGRDDTASATFFDRDVFAGARLALNDVHDTTVLAGAVVDARDGSTVARLEFERRLSNRFKLEIEGRFFLGVADDNAVAFLRQDSFLNLRLAYGL